MSMLASTWGVDVANSLFWALAIGWIITVVLHEFAHGLVAHWGGDTTIRERGGLTLNPVQYIHPFFSIALPLIFLVTGGARAIALPGGATYVRRDLLRNRWWDAAVSAAGPLMNLLIFLLLALLLSPHVGWIKPTLEALEWSRGQRFVAALALLELLTVLFNLIPLPPLDGFGIVAAFLPKDLRETLNSPRVAWPLTFALFCLLFYSPAVVLKVQRIACLVTDKLGLPTAELIKALRICLG